MRRRLERLPGMTCTEPGCGRERIWAHFEGKPYCQYHYRRKRDLLKEELVLRLVNQIFQILVKEPRIGKLIDEQLLLGIRKLFERKPAVKKKEIKAESDNAKEELSRLRLELARVEKLISQQTKRK
jgi:hypothetical protein